MWGGVVGICSNLIVHVKSGVGPHEIKKWSKQKKKLLKFEWLTFESGVGRHENGKWLLMT